MPDLKKPLNKMRSKVTIPHVHGPSDTEQRAHAGQEQDSPDGETALVEELETDPGLNPDISASRYEDDENTGDKAKKLLKATAQTVKHPIDSLQNRSHKKAASKVASARPVIPKKNDEKFLAAQEDVENRDQGHDAGVEALDRRTSHEQMQGHQEEDVEELQDLNEERDSLRVAWHTDGYVRRVAAIDKRPRRLPKVHEFEVLDENGNKTTRWDKFLGTYLLHASWPYTSPYVDHFDHVPFDTDTLRRHFQRALVVSAPLQKWIVRLRFVYRWEDPWHTAKWALLYALLLLIDRVASFFILLIIYYVAMNQSHPSRPTESKDAIVRKLDDSTSPSTVAELMDQCGQDEWLMPLFDLLGPILQLQFNDLADLLEILDNFYHWKSPTATLRTLCTLFGLVIAFNVFSVHLLLWASYLTLGLVFFGAWPISSLHPQYRLLVSQVRWAFWGVPTHASWSFGQLQKHAERVRRGLLARREKEATPDTPDLSEVDLVAFRCVYENHPGRLVVSTSSVRWQASHVTLSSAQTDSVRFHLAFPQIKEMSKKQTKARQAMPISNATKLLNSLEIVYDDVGEEKKILLNNFISRDRAFNLIVGFSGMEWKNLQPYAD